MAKQLILISLIAIVFSCTQSKNDSEINASYLGEWRMEYIKNPKYPHYVYDYSISENGDGFLVKVHVMCPKCKDPEDNESTSYYTAIFDEENNLFTIQKEGFTETLSIDLMQNYMISSRFPKYQFLRK